MKKDKLYLFGTLALFAWISMTYFLFVHRPKSVESSGSGGRISELNSLKSRMTNFESKLKESLAENSAFLKQVQDILLSNKKPSKDTLKDKAKDLVVGDDVDRKKAIKEDFSNVIPVLMFACNRVTISKSLDNLLKIRKDEKKFPIIVSQVNIEYLGIGKSFYDFLKYFLSPSFSSGLELLY